MDDMGNIVELQGTGEERPFSKAELDSMYEMAANAVKRLTDIQKKALGEIAGWNK